MIGVSSWKTRQRIHPVLPRTWGRNDESQIVPVPLLPVTRLRIRTRPLVRIYHHMTCAIKLTLLKLTNMEIHVQRRSVGTSRLFTPIPKAMVATMMGVSPALSFNVCDQMMRREIPSCLGMRLPPSLPYEISSSGSLALKII